MEEQHLKINHIPAVLWGMPSDQLFIAVHGDQSNKTDHVIRILAEEAEQKGYQVLSFDLPEHGARKEEPLLCNPQNCVAELKDIVTYIEEQEIARQISLFGCSSGAYFSMLALTEKPLAQALFLSPVVDMERIIKNMMTCFSVSEEQLLEEQEIQTPIKTLYWDDYQYVVDHPIEWNQPTALLYGGADDLCEFDYVKRFAQKCYGEMTVLEKGGHFFHTEEELVFLRQWLQTHI